MFPQIDPDSRYREIIADWFPGQFELSAIIHGSLDRFSSILENETPLYYEGLALIEDGDGAFHSVVQTSRVREALDQHDNPRAVILIGRAAALNLQERGTVAVVVDLDE